MIYKKIFVITISLAIVIIVNTYFNNIIEKYVNNTNNILEEIKLRIKDKQNVDDKKIEELEDSWNEAEKRFTLFIDHDELEKAEVEITLLKTNLEVEDYESAVEKIDTAKYMFNHIKEKVELKIKNIF